MPTYLPTYIPYIHTYTELLLPSISIQSQSWEDRSVGLQFHSRSSSSIPATMNKQNWVLRISFQWIGHKDSRIVIKVVKESVVLFEIEDWIYHPSDESLKIDRYYNCNHNYINYLETGCHFELHYAVGNDDDDGDEYESCTELRIMDFNLNVQGNVKLDEDIIVCIFDRIDDVHK